MIPLHTFLTHFFEKRQSEQGWHYRLLCSWHTIVGSLSEYMCLKKIEGTVVIIGVYDCHWMHELHMLSPMLIQSFNKALGGSYVSTIRLVSVRRSVKNTSEQKQPFVKNDSVKTLNMREEKALQAIQDSSLRDYLHRLLCRCQG